MRALQLSRLQLLAACAMLMMALAPLSPVRADEFDDEDEDEAEPVAVLLGDGNVKLEGEHAFVETFPNGVESWTPTEDSRYNGKVKSQEHEGTTGDMGMFAPFPARHYAISKSLDKPFDVSNGVVLQYEAAFLDGLECGGAYLKFITADKAFDAAKFQGDTPYSIMFGPDKCGSTNKVHVIFRHKNPKTGEIGERHMTNPVPAASDKKSHLYTLIVNKDNTYEVLIDGDIKSSGSLLEDFEGFVPETEIDDPNDSKPATWVDEIKIPDPDAKKPDDWDEDAPREILDDDAEMPDGWLIDTPEIIDDPDAVQPEDWDEEEDGEWEPPKIENPDCDEVPGCGPWERPTKPNPEYKGKWAPPLIDNPAYKGEWAPRKIPNPEYHTDTQPLKLVAPIGGVGFEVWTMSKGILIDNILVTGSEATAEELADATWQPKYDAALMREEADKPKKKTGGAPPFIIDQLRAIVQLPQLKAFRPTLRPVVDYLQEFPIVLYGVLGMLPVVSLVTIFLCCCTGGRADDVAEAKKTDAAGADDEEDEDEDDAKAGASADDSSKARRRTRRAD